MTTAAKTYEAIMGERNRILEAIDRAETAIASHPGSAEKLARSLASLTPAEMAVYQERKSLAQASGLLTHGEAQTVYAILGDWDGASIAQRMTVTQLMGQLMGVQR